jgi:hypothetical protein
MINIKKILAALATAALALPALTGAQTFDDHTKIRILRGAPQMPDQITKFECPAGSFYSGGQCTLVSMQDTSGPYVCTYYEWVITSADTGFIGSYAFPSTTDKTAVTWKDNYYAPGSVRCYRG